MNKKAMIIKKGYCHPCISLRSFENLEKWQNGLMKILGKLEKYKDTMTEEQLSRLQELFAKGEAATEKLLR